MADNPDIKEFHLFAGIGGGIYGGILLDHRCTGGVEIDKFCQSVLRRRQSDGWMEDFPIYDDVTTIDGSEFKGEFDVLCGGFPCQAFSHAAHGKNIAEKNLWDYMFKFAKDSDAPVVFGENVTEKALSHAKKDLESIGYKVHMCRVSCGDIGADHRRDRFWLLAVKDHNTLQKLFQKHDNDLLLIANCWTKSPESFPAIDYVNRRRELKAIGNAQSPFSAAVAFKILLNRHKNGGTYMVIPSKEEIEQVFKTTSTWIKQTYGEGIGYVHTPTTMANYSCPSMMKHNGCKNYSNIFGRPISRDAEYLMGFPPGASSLSPLPKDILSDWLNESKK